MLKKRLLSRSRESMTLPDERYRAVLTAERLLKDLCDPTKTPRVPKSIRSRAASALRHFPSSYDMGRAAAACPEVFVPHLDPLYKMIKRHEMGDSVSEDLRAARAAGEL
jgi:hypothetical protein